MKSVYTQSTACRLISNIKLGIIMNRELIRASDEAWDDRSLGADAAFVKKADNDIEAIIDESAGLQLISIRLNKSLIEDFKAIAALNNGIGYQTLMRQVLKRFVDCEKKRLLNEMVAAKKEEQETVTKTRLAPKQRKAA
jgi:predicted DNA binding CopG/RHH family protein